jgi:hypothetical protein
MKNIFQSKKNLVWFLKQKVFFFILGGKHFPEIIKKFKNIILFVDYKKFNSQTFDCYIFVLNFFSISPLRI